MTTTATPSTLRHCAGLSLYAGIIAVAANTFTYLGSTLHTPGESFYYSPLLLWSLASALFILSAKTE